MIFKLGLFFVMIGLAKLALSLIMKEKDKTEQEH